MSDTAKMEFASREWLDFFRKLVLARGALGMSAAAPPVTCEVYRNVPKHLSATGRFAWTRRVTASGALLEFEECPDDQADVKLIGDYQALLPLARAVIEDGKEDEFGAMMQAAIESGGVTIVREQRDQSAPRDHTVHNIMAVLTK